MAKKPSTPAVDFSQKDMSPESIANHRAQNDENAEQRMAFEIYYRMGPERGLRAVAKQVGKDKATIERWSKTFRWVPRVEEREKIAAEHNLTVQGIIDENELRKKHVRVLDAVIVKGVEAVREGTIKVKSADELLRIIDMRWKIAAQANAKPQMPMGAVNLNGPTVVDLGLGKMSREERLKFIGDMLTGIQRVSSLPSLAERAAESPGVVVDLPPDDEPRQDMGGPDFEVPEAHEIPDQADELPDVDDGGADLEV